MRAPTSLSWAGPAARTGVSPRPEVRKVLAPMTASRRLVLCLALTCPTAAGANQIGVATRPPENVKILTELDPQALRGEMRRMSAALGVTCDHCHVDGNFASDEKPPKRSARWMLKMTRALNTREFPKYQIKDGESVLGRVTCFTCHRGAIEPPTAPPAP